MCGVWCEGCRQVVRAGAWYGGRKEEGEGHLRRALKDACTCSQDAFGNSALHYASRARYSGLESIVAKLLSLGAVAALVDSVRACSYMNTCRV